MVDKKQISKLYSAAKLSETEQSVLEYLLNNIDTLDDIGIKPVAMACFTSMSMPVQSRMMRMPVCLIVLILLFERSVYRQVNVIL